MTSPSSSISSVHSGGARQDALARRKEFIRRRKQQADQQSADKVIQVRDLEKKNTQSGPNFR